MKLKAVEAQKLLSRPPLNNIKDRIKLYADEIGEDVEAVLFIEYPSNECGSVLSRAELLGTLAQVTFNIANMTDKELA